MLKVEINGKDFEIEFSNQENSQGMINHQKFELDSAEVEEGNFHIIKDHKSYVVRVVTIDQENKTMVLKVNGNRYELKISSELDQLIASFGFEKKVAKMDALKSSMPGKVIEVLVKEGENVEESQPVLILEAMKMENLVKAPVSGKIKKVLVKEGDTINKNDTLINFE